MKLSMSQTMEFHTDLTIKEMMKYDPLIMPIAIINIVPNSSLRDLVLIDTRSQGGGLTGNYQQKL